MKERLDEKTTGIGIGSPKEWQEFLENKSRKEKAKIVKRFVDKAPTCEHFSWKKGEIHARIYWCNKLNKGCNYAVCPKRAKGFIKEDIEIIKKMPEVKAPILKD